MSTKLKCIVTGKTLVATKEYYQKKLDKVKSELELHQTYICKEAKDLLLKGFSIDQIRKQLNAPAELPVPDEKIIKNITTNEYGINRNTVFSNLTAFTHQETDPEVSNFLNNI